MVFACVVLATVGAVRGQSTIQSLSMQDRLIESYIAEISLRDLYNSSGVPLSRPWQVLRQDRANFHRFGWRDPLDQWDSFFEIEENRAIMENMLSRGSISPQAARDIMSGDAIVLVEIHGTGATGRELHITVAR
ncbi:hypothetical protein GCM10010862_44320 [Devosia nitrariae]|uniref:Uncharacterized protein n=1 Tax=Devosia nitrariae TaxID=2071872 RepID=A0ABQ5WBS3_9HYPH|nr:hypothetical protein GCM10010862_44320 [Devosia nitrariae]